MTTKKESTLFIGSELVEVKEQLQHIKTVSDVFMHYICTVGKEVDFSDQQ